MLPATRWLLACALGLAARAAGQGLPAGDGHPITADGVREHLEVLASDLLQGRLAGTLGEQRAGEYIRSVLKSIDGLQPGGDGGAWFQDFTFHRWFAPLPSRNIIALLPGSDPELAGETIVIGAHYDHEGPGGGRIFNGADDNASGSATLLEIAAALAARPERPRRTLAFHWYGADDNASGSATLLEIAAALAARPERPRRTLAFHWYGAEESGLLGSAYYVSHPLRPLQGTVMMLNLDMVGRLRGRALMVGATGTSPLFPRLIPGLCRREGLVMKDEPRVSSNSDHWSFYRHKLPVVFLFTGFHDDYHKVSDEAVRINVEGAASIGALAEDIVLAVDGLDGDERPEFTPSARGKEHWVPRATIGLTMQGQTTLGGRGSARPADSPLVVAEVEPGSPAERAGVRTGDELLAVDGAPARSLATLQSALVLRGFDPQPVRLLVARRAGDADERLELTVQPEVR